MKKTIKVNGEVMNASQQGVLAAEQFLQDHYLLRRNVLNGKVEFAVKPIADTPLIARGLEGEGSPLPACVALKDTLQAFRGKAKAELKDTLLPLTVLSSIAGTLFVLKAIKCLLN